MSRSRACVAAVASVLVGAVLAAPLPAHPSESRAEARKLRFDPFRARVLPDAPRDGASREEGSFEVVLRSTSTGSAGGLANLGGHILAVGEEVAGYRLLEVGAFEAVFQKDGRELRLEVERGRDR